MSNLLIFKLRQDKFLDNFTREFSNSDIPESFILVPEKFSFSLVKLIIDLNELNNSRMLTSFIPVHPLKLRLKEFRLLLDLNNAVS